MEKVKKKDASYELNNNILTKEGYKKVKEISKEDEVVISDGNFRVLDVRENNKKTFKIGALGILPITVTDNLSFLVRTKFDSRSKGYSEPYWKEAKELTRKDYLTIPKIKDEYNYLYDLNDEELFILGRYIADGHTSKSYEKYKGVHTTRKWVLILSIGNAKVPEIKERIKETKYGLHKHTDSTHRMCFYSKRLVQIVEKECGCGAINKKLSYNVLSLPKEKLEIVVDGLMSGDGCFTCNSFKLCTISRKLAQSLCLAVYKVYGTCGKIYYRKRPKTKVIENRIVNQHDTYDVEFNKKILKNVHFKKINGEIWLPVKKISGEREKETIYNLNIEDKKRYTLNNAVVCNN